MAKPISPIAAVDIAVAGGGLAGLTAALACARQGFRVALIAPAEMRNDRRTTALLDRSTAFLDRLGVWEAIRPHARPLRVMRLVDDTGGIFHAPQTDFRAAEIGLDAFGHNVRNTDLLRELATALATHANVQMLADRVEGAEYHADGATLRLASGGTLDCRLAIAADGRNSALRAAAGIVTRQWRYPQTALVADFRHELAHGDASTEFHTRSGPFTVVPVGERECGLVWVARPQEAEHAAALPTASLEAEIERRMHSFLGKVTLLSPPQTYPLSGLAAERFGKGPLALAGEAGHVVPPIGAQGFNLAVRDVETIAQLAGECRGDPARLGTIGDPYHARRQADVATRALSIDLMNRSLLSPFLPVQLARGGVLWALNRIGPLRRLAMREGVAPGSELARLKERVRSLGGVNR
jgi:2-octaprenyl-6-methoxyphenol hydroxylase